MTLRPIARFALTALCAFPIVSHAQDDAADTDVERKPGYRYLLKDLSISIDGEGRKTLLYHNRLLVERRDAIDAVGDVSMSYNAFRTVARIVRAETVSPDGRRLPVQKEHVRDLIPEEVASYQMYDDVHQLAFSMPGVAVGSVLDYEVEIRDKKPILPGAFWHDQFLDDFVPVATARVSLTLPTRLAPVCLAQGDGVTSNETVSGSRRTIVWTREQVPALKWEIGAPPANEWRSLVRLSSLTNWSAVTTWYEGILAKHDWGAKETKELATRLTSGLTDETARIQALYRFASHDIRYVGVELGRSDYVPHACPETLKNRYGDCKDKAVLLCSLLRAAGITSHVALVRPNYAGPLDSRAPNPGQFNHAIVCVPRPGGDLWIDATTQYQNVRRYGRYLDGVEALVIGASPALRAIPAVPAQSDVSRDRIEVRVGAGAFCHVTHISEQDGQFASDGRTRWTDQALERNPADTKKQFDEREGFNRLVRLITPNRDEVDQPLLTGFEYETDHFLYGTDVSRLLWIGTEDQANALNLPSTAERRPSDRRRQAYVSRSTHCHETLVRVHLPGNMRFAKPPASFTEDLPQAKIEFMWSPKDDGAEILLRATRKPVRLTPAELEAASRQAARIMNRMQIRAEITDTDIARLLKLDVAPLLNELRAAGDSSTNAELALRLGRLHLRTGRVLEAQREIERAVALNPDDPTAYGLLVNAKCGWWGEMGPGLDHAAINAILDRAAARTNLTAWASLLRSSICLFDDSGQTPGTNAPAADAEKFARAGLVDRPKHPGLLAVLGAAMRFQGRLAEAEELLNKALEEHPSSEALLGEQVLTLIDSGQFERAYQQAIELYGGEEQARARLIATAFQRQQQRNYEAAAPLFRLVTPGAAQPEGVRRLASLCEVQQAALTNDYRTWFDDSSASAAERSLTIASLMRDSSREDRLLSRYVPRGKMHQEPPFEQQTQLQQLLRTTTSVEGLCDSVVSIFTFTERSLENGDIEVTAEPDEEFATGREDQQGGSRERDRKVSLATREDGHWRILTSGTPVPDLIALSRVAAARLAESNTPAALFYVRRIQAMLTVAPEDFLLSHVKFTNRDEEVRAWIGNTLSRMESHEDADLAADLLDAAVRTNPDPTLGVIRMYAQMLAGRDSAAREQSRAIDPASLTRPSAVAQLAYARLDLDDPDGAQKALIRLRELSANDPKPALLAAQIARRQRDTNAWAAAIAELRTQRDAAPAQVAGSELAMAALMNDTATVLRVASENRGLRATPAQRLAVGKSLRYVAHFDGIEEPIGALILRGLRAPILQIEWGRVAALCGDTEAMEDHLHRARELMRRDPDTTETADDLAVLEMIGGHYRDAATFFEQRGREHRARGLYLLCLASSALAAAGEAKQAADLLAVARNTPGEDPWPRLLIETLEGRLTAAEARRKIPSLFSPDDRDDHLCELAWHLAARAEGAGKLEEARREYQACVDGNARMNTEYEYSVSALRRLATKK